MTLTRTPLALLALAAFAAASAPAYAGEAGAMHAPASTACQVASCSMDPAKTAHPAPDPATDLAATGPWYLPTWEEASAATCDEAQRPAAPAATAPAAWYLPTWEETAAAATEPMACCETPCPMAPTGQAQPAPAGKPAESWYLPS